MPFETRLDLAAVEAAPQRMIPGFADSAGGTMTITASEINGRVFATYTAEDGTEVSNDVFILGNPAIILKGEITAVPIGTEAGAFVFALEFPGSETSRYSLVSLEIGEDGISNTTTDAYTFGFQGEGGAIGVNLDLVPIGDGRVVYV